MDGAVHVCQTMGVCDAMARRFSTINHTSSRISNLQSDQLYTPRYTCEECVEGLDWVQMYMEDPIMIAEFTIYLEQNYCIGSIQPFQIVQTHALIYQN